MKIVIYSESQGRLGVAEYHNETEKSYLVKSIKEIKFENMNWNTRISKDRALFVGDISTEIGELIDMWNDNLEKKAELIKRVRELYDKIFDEIRDRITELNKKGEENASTQT